MANNVYYIRGVANWAKVVGDPVPNYNKDGTEWTIDVTPDEEGMKLLKKLKLSSKIKDKVDDRKEFIQFKQKSTRIDKNTGEEKKNRPPEIVDREGQPWDDSKIGNGSVVDVKFTVIPYGTTTGVYLQGIRVMKHVPYEGGSGWAPVDEDDEFFAAEETPKKPTKKLPGKTVLEDLDDEIPY